MNDLLEDELSDAKAEVRVLQRWNRRYGDVGYQLNRAKERVASLEGRIDQARNPRRDPYLP